MSPLPLTEIDFKALLLVVRELDGLRFKSVLSDDELSRLREFQIQFKGITNGRQIPPRRFVTDGCTLSTDAFGVEFCVLHDLAYWLGGTREEKLAADHRLRTGTATRSKFYAPIQFAGVRLFGGPRVPDHILNKQFRWGFGWDYPAPGEPGIVY